MKGSLVIPMTLANCGSIENAESIYEFLESEVDGIEIYELRKRPFMAAAFDHVIVLSVIGSIASIASFLWLSYEKFIKPKKDQDSDTAGIHLVVYKPDGIIAEFWIGNTHKDKDVFLEDFTSVANECTQYGNNFELTEMHIDFKNVDNWMKRK
jgi:hypothetical protein